MRQSRLIWNHRVQKIFRGVWRVQIEVPNTVNLVNKYNAYWGMWRATFLLTNKVAEWTGSRTLKFVKDFKSNEYRRGKTEVKKISNTADKLIIGCGTPGLDLRRTLTYARPDSLIMEYYVRPSCVHL